MIITSCYFDDNVCISTPELSRSTEVALSTLLDLLGWSYDRSGEKSDWMTEEVSGEEKV